MKERSVLINRIGLAALLVLLLAAGSCSTVPVAVSHKDDYKEAFIYGFPMIMGYGIMYEYNIDRNSGQFKGPFNQILNESRVFTPKDTAVVTPNSDTPYSLVSMDLRAEPMVICVPAVEKSRYYSVQLVDMYTFNYGYIGSRATGNDAGCYMVAGPDWKGAPPAGIAKVFPSETQFSLAIFRTQLFNPADIENVKKVQAGYKAEPLSTFLHKPAPPAAPKIDFPKIDKELAKSNPFQYLNFILQFCPAPPEETELRAKFAKVGIAPGQPFDLAKLPETQKAEMLLGMKEGFEDIQRQAEHIGKSINGWNVGAAQGNRSFYRGDWLLRAGAAQMGIYGNDPEEATYPATKKDKTGAPLDGHEHKYTLTFPQDLYPPVNAFWSVTMYDGKTQLLVANPIDRYLINSPMLSKMKKNKDGSLTIYIQKDSPGAANQANWLPAPDGPIYVVMRLYWPTEKAPSILPPGAGTWQPPALEIVQ
jgi:hypothetical protein